MIFSAAMVSFWNISERRQSYASDTSDGSVCSLPSSAPKLLSSPQNAAITAGGTPYSFSARLNAAACILIRACAFFAAPSDALLPCEFGEHLAEHALATVAVDDALVVDEVGRGLGQRALRDALRHGLLLEVGEKTIEAHAIVAGRATAWGHCRGPRDRLLARRRNRLGQRRDRGPGRGGPDGRGCWLGRYRR